MIFINGQPQIILYHKESRMFNYYIMGLLESSNKFVVLFKLLEETIKVGERMLLFSQSLLTLDLIETFLQERTIPSKYVSNLLLFYIKINH